MKRASPRTTPMASTASTARDPRWAAVVARDRAADGAFVYSVATTGVYCRPSCASRQARRENVRFHASCADAEAAGFRACKRCAPNRAADEARTTIVARCCRLIAAAETPPSLDELARAVGLSRGHLHRMFRAVTGLTPKAYADGQRAERVRAELATAPSVTAAIYGACYQANSRFYAASDAILGMTPTAFRAGGADATIRFALGACALGSILVAATTIGVCAVLLGDDPAALTRDLHGRFPRATLIAGERDFARLVARVVRAVETTADGDALPLDLRGTAFQRRVWQALRRIPSGSTITYGELARRIGAPGAVRAVAGACAANAVAVLVPCHRVVRSDGSLSGYRWGVERKRALLARESKHPRR